MNLKQLNKYTIQSVILDISNNESLIYYMFIRHSVMEWVIYSSPQEASGWSDDFFPKGSDESNIRILSSLECKTEIGGVLYILQSFLGSVFVEYI